MPAGVGVRELGTHADEDDPGLGIDWGDAEVTGVSERDAALGGVDRLRRDVGSELADDG